MVLMIVKEPQMWVFFPLFLLWRTQLAKCITCACHVEPVQFQDLACAATGFVCGPENVVGCSLTRDVQEFNDRPLEIVRRMCLFDSRDHADITCSSQREDHLITCCFQGDLCNENLTLPPLLPVTTAMPTDVTTQNISTDDQPSGMYRQITIAVPIVSTLTILLIIAGTISLLYLLRRRKMKIERTRLEQRHVNGGDREPSPVYSPYSLDTLDLEEMTCTSGSGSGEPLLTQRTIARNIKIGESIGSGRFGQVFVGEFQGDKVAVKKFASRDEKSWFRESEIYNTVLLRHDNILGFIACDVFSNNGVTELWLITQYYPHGSLFDYLNRYSVSPKIMMRMAISTCKGLTHLHTEFSGTSAKPAIAHRDIKSKNILVKNNRECCLADFGLAVMKGSSSNLNLPMNPKQGTKRYMAPEILSESIDLSRFESFKKADIYAFGLVLWEICKRCGDKNDSVGDYEPPFHGMVGADPSFEEMRKVVVTDKRLPTIPRQWQNDDLLQGMTSVMTECWYFDSDARNETLFYKVKLMQLAKEDKIDYDVQE